MILAAKIRRIRPKIVAFNGKGIYGVINARFNNSRNENHNNNHNENHNNRKSRTIFPTGTTSGYFDNNSNNDINSTRKRKTCKFPMGKQSHFFPGTESYIFVLPSSSAR